MMKDLYPTLAMALLGLVIFFNRSESVDTNAQIKEAPSQVHSFSHLSSKKLERPTTTSTPLTSAALPNIPDLSAQAPSNTLESLDQLPSAEQKSLWNAFSEARREVRPFSENRAQREENKGYDFYALHPKQNITTRFGAHGIQIVSSDRTYTDEDAHHLSTSWQAQMRLLSFAGEPVQGWTQPQKPDQNSVKVEYHHHSGLTEWFNNGAEGLEHGYTITARPASLSEGEDVSFEVSVGGLQAIQKSDGENQKDLAFMDGEREVLSYSKLLVIDARGRELPATMKPTETGFIIAYNDTQAVYPVIVDPLIINEGVKLTGTDAAAFDNFGQSVAITGNTIVIGAIGDDDGGSGSGSAYVFTRESFFSISWTLEAKLTADDAATNDKFGISVDISGNSIVIGADGNDGDNDDRSGSGSAYVFVRNDSSWSQQAKLTADDAEAFDFFGASVKISSNSFSDDYVIVGAHGTDDNGPNSGSVYIFINSDGSWSQQEKIIANDTSSGDQFGVSVAISSSSIVIGASGDDDGEENSGSAYVYSRNGSSWFQRAKLTADDATPSDHFGTSVDMSGSYVIIGAKNDDEKGTNSGSAYIFKFNLSTSWTQQAKLTANDATAFDFFGTSVAIRTGSTVIAVIGATGDDNAGESSGAAYIFTLSDSSWTQQKLTADDAGAGDQFGISVAITGNSIVIGAFADDDSGTSSGSAYAFNKSRFSDTWNQQPKLIAGYTNPSGLLGTSVDISGDSAVIGSSGDDDQGTSSGAVYVFTRSGTSWSQQAKLIADGIRRLDRFGTSVGIVENYVIVGAPGNNAAYIFIRNGTLWSEQTKLTADDTEARDRFGASVDISVHSVVIGAHIKDNSGAAYVFTRNGSFWSQQAKLKANDAERGDNFGESVAISGHTIIVGAAFQDNSGLGLGSNSGSAYIFTRNGSFWSQQAKLNADNAAANDLFGISVDISNDSAVIGATQNSAAGEAAGSAYVFTRSGSSWTQQERLNADDAESSDLFGSSVVISGETVVIGANGENDSGSAYIFTRSGSSWSQQAKLKATDAEADDHFGGSAAISGNTILIGAKRDDNVGENSGSVYIYRFASPSVRSLLVFDHLNTGLSNGSAATSFHGQQLGTSQDFTFHLGNSGELALDIQSISIGGSDAAQFSLTLPDISSTIDLTNNQSLDYTITFDPTGTNSGPRNATVLITSNDTNNPVFSFTIIGLGLSNTKDGDNDGMNDWAEYTLRGMGFDWENNQSALVSDLFTNASNAGLYTESQIAAISGSTSLVEVDMTTNTASFIIGLEESSDLDTFTPIIIDPNQLSADDNGNIRYEVNAPPGKKLFRSEFKR